MRMKAGIMILLAVMLCVAGCATTSQDQTMMTQMQMRIGELERQVDAKDQRITELEYTLKDLSYDVKRAKEQPRTPVVSRPVSVASVPPVDGEIIRVNASAEDVQRALKSAGYYSGAIDGKIGSGTKQAIVQFQKDKNLKADGIVGRQTWELLKSFSGQ